MSLPFELKLPGFEFPLFLEAGQTTIIVGANGSGKTKLAVACEDAMLEGAFRVSAQRMLSIDPSIPKTSERQARNKHRLGYADADGTRYDFADLRREQRWQGFRPGSILDDANSLLQILFAEQANTTVAKYNADADGVAIEVPEPLIRQLKRVWERVLPTRRLDISADDIRVRAVRNDELGDPYAASGMSDGEKAVFYLIGQTLIADPGVVLIIDEPEVHIHRSILGRLWDELEALRPDCALLLITHDLEFAASRQAAKYVLRGYDPAAGWAIEPVPTAEGFSEELVTLILGSRRAVLFVEGAASSLDIAWFRACYPDWTIVSRSSCEQVIHAVRTMRANQTLHRVTCAGIVDADSRDLKEIAELRDLGVYALPVAEIENLLLLPDISRAIVDMLGFEEQEARDRLSALKRAVFADAQRPESAQQVIVNYCRRRMNRILSTIDLTNGRSVTDLVAARDEAAGIDIGRIAAEIEGKIEKAIGTDDLPALLAIYDRKGALISLAASKLANWKVGPFIAWVTRSVESKNDPRLRDALNSVLEMPIPG